MRLYLARKRNGLYQLTALQPVREMIKGTDYDDIFVTPGDPINFQGLCPFSVQKLFGQELNHLEVMRVRITAQNLTEATATNA